MKQVQKLKKKHRNDLWLDNFGYLWFYSVAEQDWATLERGYWSDGFEPIVTVEAKGWKDAPFTRIARGLE